MIFMLANERMIYPSQVLAKGRYEPLCLFRLADIFKEGKSLRCIL